MDKESVPTFLRIDKLEKELKITKDKLDALEIRYNALVVAAKLNRVYDIP